jgi:hypothetical protein
MNTSDLIEALSFADKLFLEKHGKHLEIFDLCFSEGDFDGDLHIQGAGEVVYKNGGFGYGEKIGKRPHEDFRVHFQVEDNKIVDRSIEMGKYEDLME